MNTNMNTNTTKTTPNAVIAFKPGQDIDGHYFTQEMVNVLASAPTMCAGAVERLTGAPFVPGLHDLAPLVRVVMQGIRRAMEAGEADPCIFMRDLLDTCCEAGKAYFQSRWNMGLPEEMNPVAYLAAMLENGIEIWFPAPAMCDDPCDTFSNSKAYNRQRAGHAARP
jgi:hypothetical protein